MQTLTKVLVGLAALSFVVAVISKLFFGGWTFGINAEPFSKACTNLTLLAIALAIVFKQGNKEE